MRLLLLAVLALAVVPSSAEAISLGAVRAALPKAQAVAEDYWSADACDGQVRVELLTRAALKAIRGDEADAQALPDRCLIQITSGADTTRTGLCATMVHERGHLHGSRFPANVADPFHSPNPVSIMFAGVGNAPRACMEAFPPFLVQKLRRAGRRCSPLLASYSWRCRGVVDDMPAI